MPGIITLTMNPALDLTTSVKKVVPLHKLRCAPEQYYAGGGGLNVARALRRLGATATAVFPAGGITGRRLADLLSNEQVTSVAVPIVSDTRENFAVLETSSGQQYRFVLPGPELSAKEVRSCLDECTVRTEAGDFLIVSGSLPRGLSLTFYDEVKALAVRNALKLVVDASGTALKQALGKGTFLIKPSFTEFVELTGVSPLNESDAVRAARALIARDDVQLIALSLGDRGAWLIGRDVALAATAPALTPLSTIGAGDTFLAGIISVLAANGSMAEALRMGVAAGAAAVLAPGVDLCRGADVERLAPLVQIRELTA